MKVFDLLVMAIVTIILVSIIVNLFIGLNAEKDLLKELEENLLLAKTNTWLGKTIALKPIKLDNDHILSQTDFDLTKHSIAIECNDPSLCCPINEECEKIEWTQGLAKLTKNKTYTFFVRCIYDKIDICKIYFGKLPAQASIEEIKIIKQSGTSIVLETTVKNIGKQNLLNGITTIKLFKKVKEKWEETSEVFPEQNITLITPNQQHSFIWNIETKTIGEYQAKLLFSGHDAGFDSKLFDFNSELNIYCSIDETKQNTIFNEETKKFEQIYYCNGCNFSYECVAKWSEIKSNTEWHIIDKDSIYCETNSANQTC